MIVKLERPSGAHVYLSAAAWLQYDSASEGMVMLRLAVIFLVVALIAALFGFGLVAGLAYNAAKILFFIFLVLAVMSFLGGAFRAPRV